MNYDPVAEFLKPKDGQIIKQAENGAYYRPRSIQQTRSRPPTQSSSKTSKRIVYVRNGKKIENKLDELPIKAESNCQDVDLIENIDLEDPIWKQILPDYIPFDQPTIEKLIEDNPDYFYHQLGLCACYRCKCGRCKCDISNQLKLKINGSFVTVYEKDYQPHRFGYNNINTLNQTTYTTKFLDQKNIDLITNHQNDYKEQPFQTQESFKPAYRPQIGQMSNLTSYRSNFNNWGTNYQKYKSIPHISTSQDIKFNSKTIYQDTFCNPKYRVETLSHFKSTLSPLPTGPFVGLTTSQTSFQPFKISSHGPRKGPQKYETTPCFDGQFTSTGMRDFGYQVEDYCPANHYQKLFRKKLSVKQQQKKDQYYEKRINQMKN